MAERKAGGSRDIRESDQTAESHEAEVSESQIETDVVESSGGEQIRSTDTIFGRLNTNDAVPSETVNFDSSGDAGGDITDNPLSSGDAGRGIMDNPPSTGDAGRGITDDPLSTGDAGGGIMGDSLKPDVIDTSGGCQIRSDATNEATMAKTDVPSEDTEHSTASNDAMLSGDAQDRIIDLGIRVRDSRSPSGSRDADEAYDKFFEEFFPNYNIGVHRVPPVFIGNPRYNDFKWKEVIPFTKAPWYLVHENESNIAGDQAEKLVADSIEKLLDEKNEQAFIITSYNFLDENNRKGEHDLLIVHVKYGVIFVQVKNTNGDKKKIEEAFDQCENDEKFFKTSFQDLKLNISVKSTIALPNICKGVLKHKIKNLIEKKGRFVEHCLFKDEMSEGRTNMNKSLEEWWSKITADSRGFASDDDFKRVIARYIGFKSTVKYRNYSDCVVEMDKRCTNIVLTPEQVFILGNHLSRLVIHGQFGTGKTVLLILKVTSMLQNKEKVCVVTMCHSPLEEKLRKSIQEEVDPECFGLSRFEQIRDQEELSRILRDCAEQDRHVFIDEFPSFTKKNTLKTQIATFPPHLVLWCIMSREREPELTSVLTDLFEPKSYRYEPERTSSAHNVNPEQASDEKNPPGFEKEVLVHPTKSQPHGSGDACKGLFLHLRMTKILRCPPTVYQVIPNVKSETVIVTYTKGKNITTELAGHFHSLGLNTSKTQNRSGSTTSLGLKWEDVVVVSKESKPLYAICEELQIPLSSWTDRTNESDVTNKAGYLFKIKPQEKVALKSVKIKGCHHESCLYIKGPLKDVVNDISMNKREIANLLRQNGFSLKYVEQDDSKKGKSTSTLSQDQTKSQPIASVKGLLAENHAISQPSGSESGVSSQDQVISQPSGSESWVSSQDQVISQPSGSESWVSSQDQVISQPSGSESWVSSQDQVISQPSCSESWVSSQDQVISQPSGSESWVSSQDQVISQPSGSESGVSSQDQVITQPRGSESGVSSQDQVISQPSGSESWVSSQDQVISQPSGSESGLLFQDQANSKPIVTEESQRDWSEVIFLEELPSAKVLRDLGIPIVTPAVTAVDGKIDNRVLYTSINDVHILSHKEVILFEDGKAIANPGREHFYEGPIIRYMDHTKHDSCPPEDCHQCQDRLGQIFQQLGYAELSSVSGNDVVILDARRNPESIAGLFQRCGLPVVDKLNAGAEEMNALLSSSEVIYVKPGMFAGLEKKIVFVVEKDDEELISSTRFKTIEDPVMLARTRYTSQLVIITTN